MKRCSHCSRKIIFDDDTEAVAALLKHESLFADSLLTRSDVRSDELCPTCLIFLYIAWRTA